MHKCQLQVGACRGAEHRLAAWLEDTAFAASKKASKKVSNLIRGHRLCSIVRACTKSTRRTGRKEAGEHRRRSGQPARKKASWQAGWLAASGRVFTTQPEQQSTQRGPVLGRTTIHTHCCRRLILMSEESATIQRHLGAVLQTTNIYQLWQPRS